MSSSPSRAISGRLMSMARRARVTVACAAVTLVAACGNSSVNSLILAGDEGGAFGAGLPATAANAGYTFGAVLLCAQGNHAGAIAVVGVTLLHSNGHLHLDGFGLRRTGTPFGSGRSTLAEAGFVSTPTPVRGHCPQSGWSGTYELAVQVRRDDFGPDGSASQLAVAYTAGSRHRHVVVVPFALRLCRDNVTCPAPLRKAGS